MTESLRFISADMDIHGDASGVLAWNIGADDDAIDITFSAGTVTKVWLQFDLNDPYTIYVNAGAVFPAAQDGADATHIWPMVQVTITDGDVSEWLLLQHDEIHLPRAG
jgi:hypothetical protein